jgi:hypothetical protein
VEYPEWRYVCILDRQRDSIERNEEKTSYMMCRQTIIQCVYVLKSIQYPCLYTPTTVRTETLPTGPCCFSVPTQVSNNKLYIKCVYVYLNKGRLNSSWLDQLAGCVQYLRCVLAETQASARRVGIRKCRMYKLCFRCR